MPVDELARRLYLFVVRITQSIWFIRAEGHTRGNAIVIVEDAEEGLYYLIHGDITYCDEALYANKLSIVFDDLAAARETMDRVRAFVAHYPTVYLSTHTPQGAENLAAKRVVDLDNPTETIPVGEITFKTRTGTYVCNVCGYGYDPTVGDETQGVLPGTPFEDLPDDEHCPRCKQSKDRFSTA